MQKLQESICLASHRPGLLEKFAASWKKLKLKVDDAIKRSERHGKYALTKAQEVARVRAELLRATVVETKLQSDEVGGKDESFVVIYEDPSEMALRVVIERGVIDDESFDCKCFREKTVVKDPPMGPAWRDMALPVYEWGEEQSSSAGDYVVAVLWVRRRVYDAQEAETEAEKIERMKEVWDGNMKSLVEKSTALKKYETVSIVAVLPLLFHPYTHGSSAAFNAIEARIYNFDEVE